MPGICSPHMRPPRVVILTSIMAPHRIAAFNALAADPDLDVAFVYLTRDRPEPGLGHSRGRHAVPSSGVARTLAMRRGGSYLHLTTGLVGALRELRPDVLVVGGWDQVAYFQAYGLPLDHWGQVRLVGGEQPP